ncbi:MAG: hypothetical protein P8Y27_07640, partial [Chromatiaceae bacterium]
MLRLSGAWVTSGLAGVEMQLAGFSAETPRLTIDAYDLDALDTAGALVIYRLLEGLEGQGKAAQ